MRVINNFLYQGFFQREKDVNSGQVQSYFSVLLFLILDNQFLPQGCSYPSDALF